MKTLLSGTTCLMQPQLFSTALLSDAANLICSSCFVVSRIKKLMKFIRDCILLIHIAKYILINEDLIRFLTNLVRGSS